MFGSLGTRTIYASQTLLLTDKTIDVDATAGPITVTLLPFSELPNENLFVQKIDSSANAVTWQCAGDGTKRLNLYWPRFCSWETTWRPR